VKEEVIGSQITMNHPRFVVQAEPAFQHGGKVSSDPVFCRGHEQGKELALDIVEEAEPIVAPANCIGEGNPLLIEYLMRNAMELVEKRPYLLCQMILQGFVQLKEIVSLQRLAWKQTIHDQVLLLVLKEGHIDAHKRAHERKNACLLQQGALSPFIF